MTITTGLHAAHQPFYSGDVNENKINSDAVSMGKNISSNNINIGYEELAAGLKSYAQSWQESLQLRGQLIDTSPAQAVLKTLQPLLSPQKNISSNSDDVISDWEIYDQVCEKLDYMQTNYMDIYAQVTEQYQLYMQDVNSFKISLTNYMDNGTDEIKLNLAGIKSEINKVIDKWEQTPILTVNTKEDADYWQDQLGLPYKESADGYSFYVNLQPMYDIRDSVNQLSSPLSTARFNQWQNSVNSACSTIESDTQIIAQKYSQANTVFNNLAKILSATMDSLYQTDKEYLRN